MRRAFSVYEPDASEMMAIFYQTGYLTIKSARQDGEERLYRLDFPNYEVRKVAFDAEMRNLSDPLRPRDDAESRGL